MRLIDASELIQVLCINMDSGEQFSKATHCVDAMPTVDAVPVIRCSECLYKSHCESYRYTKREDAYCAWAVRAERKEE